MPVLIYIDTDDKVRGLQEVHPQTFTNIPVMRDRMPQKLVDFGSVRAVAALPDNHTDEMLDAMRYYVPARILWSAVGFHGSFPFAFGGGEPDPKYLGGRSLDTMPAHFIK